LQQQQQQQLRLLLLLVALLVSVPTQSRMLWCQSSTLPLLLLLTAVLAL
jgi:hypothetical protein